MNMHTAEPQAENLDILWGVAAIAEFLNLSERQAEHQINQGTLPTGLCGRLRFGFRSRLKEHLERLVTEAAAAARLFPAEEKSPVVSEKEPATYSAEQRAAILRYRTLHARLKSAIGAPTAATQSFGPGWELMQGSRGAGRDPEPVLGSAVAARLSGPRKTTPPTPREAEGLRRAASFISLRDEVRAVEAALRAVDKHKAVPLMARVLIDGCKINGEGELFKACLRALVRHFREGGDAT
jgi:hypothetical protein